MPHFICIRAAVILSAIMAAGPAAAQTKLVDTFRDWATFRHDGAPGKVCFALTKPLSSLPKTAPRSPAFLYVSAWPQDGVRAEISIKMGYAVRKDRPASIKIGPASFKLLIEDDKAFVIDPNAELKLLDAMKLGATLTVQASAAGGTTMKDTYSLRGITKAILSLTRTCR